MTPRTKMLVVSMALSFCSGAVNAECATDEEITAYIADYIANIPTKALSAGGTMEDAVCTQGKLVAALSQKLGPVVGYKAGLTSKPAQERFGVKEPVYGVLYSDMLLENGAEISEKFGARPMFEADLVLVVGSTEINKAVTAEGAIKHISAVRPFIELPDLTFAEGEPISGVTLTANGVGPKFGVIGDDIPITDSAAMLQALADMSVVITASDDEVLAKAEGSAVLGNPVNSVLWLMSKGIEFKQGDLISVGSIGPLLPPFKAKGKASVVYNGLPGNPMISVTFK